MPSLYTGRRTDRRRSLNESGRLPQLLPEQQGEPTTSPASHHQGSPPHGRRGSEDRRQEEEGREEEGGAKERRRSPSRCSCTRGTCSHIISCCSRGFLLLRWLELLRQNGFCQHHLPPPQPRHHLRHQLRVRLLPHQALQQLNLLQRLRREEVEEEARKHLRRRQLLLRRKQLLQRKLVRQSLHLQVMQEKRLPRATWRWWQVNSAVAGSRSPPSALSSKQRRVIREEIKQKYV